MTIKLVKTCGACPEQYDAFIGDRQVGYLRLRHGAFTVDCPDACGIEVYSAVPKGGGMFDDDERDYYLRHAVAAIQLWVDAGEVSGASSAETWGAAQPARERDGVFVKHEIIGIADWTRSWLDDHRIFSTAAIPVVDEAKPVNQPSRQRLYRNEGGVWRTKTCKPDESEIAANIALGWHYWSNELWCHWNKKNDAGRLSKEEPES